MGRHGSADLRRVLRLLAEFALFTTVRLRTNHGQVSMAGRGSDADPASSMLA